MKKLNNKGFAISAILYTLLALILILMVVMLAVMGSRKNTINKVNEDVVSDINTERSSNSNSNGGDSNSNGGDSNSNVNLSINWRKDIFPGNYANTTALYNDYTDISLNGNGAIQAPSTSNSFTGFNIISGPDNTQQNYKKGYYLSNNNAYICFKTPANVKGTIYYVIGGPVSNNSSSDSSVRLRLNGNSGSVLQTSTAPKNNAKQYTYSPMEASTTYCLFRNSRNSVAYIYSIFLYSPGGEEL